MNAVRSEVEELRERIVQLEESMRRLQAENDFWRSIASPAQMIQMEEHMQRLGFPPSIDYTRQQQ